MTGARGSPLVRFAAFALLAVVVPAAILAVLGYHSLRQWHRSAEAPVPRAVAEHGGDGRRKRSTSPSDTRSTA